MNTDIPDDFTHGADDSRRALLFSGEAKLAADTRMASPAPDGTGDSSRSELVREFHQNFSGQISGPDSWFIAAEMVDFCLERIGARPTTRAGLDREAVAEVARRVTAKYRQAFHLLVNYQEKQRPKFPKPANGLMFTPAEMEAHFNAAFEQALMSTRAMALELEFKTVAGGEKPAHIAKRFGYIKFTFCKCCERFQRGLRLGLREGQRDEDARGAMTESRNNQLKPENDHDEKE